jgi:uncharacterized protein
VLPEQHILGGPFVNQMDIKVDLLKLASIRTRFPLARVPSQASLGQSPAGDCEQAAMLSPCTGICTLDERDLCEGCFRTGAEIAAWRDLTAAQRAHLMDVILPAREAVGSPALPKQNK